MTWNHKTPRGKHTQNTLWHKSQQYFLDPSSKVKERIAKINKCDLIKLKSFCTAKEAVNKIKRQPTEWEKIFANDMTNKRLISNIYIQFIQLNIKKQTTWLKNWQKNWIGIFPERKCRWPTDIWKDAQLANHQGNENQNHNEISHHICQNNYHQKVYK